MADTAAADRRGSIAAGRLRAAAVAAVLSAIASATPGRARTAGPDWKFYGGVSSTNGQSWCFYDANDVVREPAGRVRLAAKCLSQTDTDGVTIETGFGGAIAREVARRTRGHYVPPYAMAQSAEAGQTAGIARLEATADIAGIAPRVKISYELDCGKKLARELSLYVQVNGSVRSVDQPGEWKDISPEANSVRLFRILCQAGRTGFVNTPH